MSPEHIGTETRGGDTPGSSLTFGEVLEINRDRSAQWHPPGSETWTGADWSNAMQAEAGEAGNVVKKLRRIETGVPGSRDPNHDELLEQLGDEIADTFLYLGLLADHYDIDVPSAIARKFNAVSEREGFPHRLREC